MSLFMIVVFLTSSVPVFAGHGGVVVGEALIQGYDSVGQQTVYFDPVHAQWTTDMALTQPIDLTPQQLTIQSSPQTVSIILQNHPDSGWELGEFGEPVIQPPTAPTAPGRTLIPPGLTPAEVTQFLAGQEEPPPEPTTPLLTIQEIIAAETARIEAEDLAKAAAAQAQATADATAPADAAAQAQTAADAAPEAKPKIGQHTVFTCKDEVCTAHPSTIIEYRDIKTGTRELEVRQERLSASKRAVVTAQTRQNTAQSNLDSAVEALGDYDAEDVQDDYDDARADLVTAIDDYDTGHAGITLDSPGASILQQYERGELDLDTWVGDLQTGTMDDGTPITEPISLGEYLNLVNQAPGMQGTAEILLDEEQRELTQKAAGVLSAERALEAAKKQVQSAQTRVESAKADVEAEKEQRVLAKEELEIAREEAQEQYEDAQEDLADFKDDIGLTRPEADIALGNTLFLDFKAEIDDLVGITFLEQIVGVKIDDITIEDLEKLKEDDPEAYEELAEDYPNLYEATEAYIRGKEDKESVMKELGLEEGGTPTEEGKELNRLKEELDKKTERHEGLTETEIAKAALTSQETEYIDKIIGNWPSASPEEQKRILSKLSDELGGSKQTKEKNEAFLAALQEAAGGEHLLDALKEELLKNLMDVTENADDPEASAKQRAKLAKAYGAAQNAKPDDNLNGVLSNSLKSETQALQDALTELEAAKKTGVVKDINKAKRDIATSKLRLKNLAAGMDAVVQENSDIEKRKDNANKMLDALRKNFDPSQEIPQAVSSRFLANIATAAAPSMNLIADGEARGAYLAARIKADFGDKQLSRSDVDALAFQLNSNLKGSSEAEAEERHANPDTWAALYDAGVIDYDRKIQGQWETSSGLVEAAGILGDALWRGLWNGITGLWHVDSEYTAAQIALGPVAFMGNIIRIYNEWKGLGAFFSLNMDEEKLREKGEEFDQIFCQELGLSGINCWISKICQMYPDEIQASGNTVVTSTAAGDFTYGAHIEAERTLPFAGFNETAIIGGVSGRRQGGMFLYKVQFNVVNTDKIETMHYNILWGRQSGAKRHWPESPTLDPQSGADYTSGNGLYIYSPEDYTDVCLQMSPGIIDYAGKEHTRICTPIVPKDVQATQYEHLLSTQFLR